MLTEVKFTPIPIDTSDKDGSINANQLRNLYSLPMADGLDAFTHKGQTYIITAGEGDDRAGDLANCISIPVKARASSVLGADVANLGSRLNLITTASDYDKAGKLDQAYSFGSRGFRMYDQNQNLIFDSGSQFEEIAKQLGVYDDLRSDDREPRQKWWSPR